MTLRPFVPLEALRPREGVARVDPDAAAPAPTRPCELHGESPRCARFDGEVCTPRVPDVRVIRPPHPEIPLAGRLVSAEPEITICLPGGAHLIVFDFARGVVTLATEGALKGAKTRPNLLPTSRPSIGREPLCDEVVPIK